MSESPACRECGTNLPADATGGLCPKCRLGTAGDHSRASAALVCWTLVFLAASIVGAIASQRPPAERPADAPAAEFSSRRAFEHIQAIAAKPRPAGSPEIALARAYLVRTIDSLDLARITQTTRYQQANGRAVEISNIVARIKGAGPPGQKAVLLMAHYDSVPAAPGACDDGSGTATLLEALRALKAGPLPKRDIIALFTDGEEIGLIGSRFFVGGSRGGWGEGHPWMPDVGLVLNFDAAGNHGPCCLFETSGRNGWLIREFAQADPIAIGDSLTPVVYRMTGSRTDMNNFLNAGVPALNFLFFEGKGCYHSPLDNLSNLDGRSLQHQGSHALALARHFGNLDQDDPGEPDVIYFNPVGRWFIHYPGTWVQPLAVGAALCYFAVLFAGWHYGRAKAGGLALGFVALPLAMALGTLAAWGVWWLLKQARTVTEWQSSGGLVAACLLAIAVVVFVSFYAFLLKRVAFTALDLGWLGWAAIIAVASAWLLPEGSFFPVWPLLLRLATTALAWRVPWRPLAILLIDLGTLPAITIIAPAAYVMLTGMDLDTVLFAVAIALFVPAATLPQLGRLACALTRTGVTPGPPDPRPAPCNDQT